MLTFQTHQLLMIFIAICITQSVYTQLVDITATCTIGYTPNGYHGNGICFESAERLWQCPQSECSYEGHKYAPMHDCQHGWPPLTSQQNCAGYKLQKNYYECGTADGKTYNCPIPKGSPFIRCNGCKPT
ncbi:uncharacterized protein MELLADRAFT_104486 [Melampsora larici-populina 98AG31]|uniref:Secreted protein n=1 Tax=Melampsora larici-populina (strain 98AG31 / pathotype 3-4-7) TaxID=747676 RepID=F4REV4_MELLP|nr:uncharacterized protein MELLADRAFT_104486 [Melampsora larici-populina 98AG31]EGG09169.1 secreted protein [Melampsora larici-populina 98AG31]